MRDNSRCQVEILLTEFWDPISGPLFPNRGDQERFWKITRRFIEELSTALKGPRINAVYPDSGVAAMLSYQWKDSGLPCRITSLTDRFPVTPEDEVIIVACPDPPGADECIKLVRTAREQDEQEGRPYRPVVLFNPRLSSGDVGLGLNARRLRQNFTKNFTVTYSLRPIADVGSVYRRYPGLWKVFLEEEGISGRYRMIAEVPSRPAGENLDFMIREATNPATLGPDGQPAPSQGQQSFINQVQSVVASLNYFMKSLSR